MSKVTSEPKKPTLPPPTKGTPPPRGWRGWMPWAVTGFFALWIIGNLRPQAEKSAFNVNEFGKLPAVLEGRIQPMDSVARNTLLVMRSKQTLALEPEATMGSMERLFKTKRMPAIEWLLEVMTRPEQADKRKVFRIDFVEVKSLLKLNEAEKHFSFEEIKPNA